MRGRIWVFISPQEQQISTNEGGGGLAAILMQDVTCAVNLLPNELVHVCARDGAREEDIDVSFLHLSKRRNS